MLNGARPSLLLRWAGVLVFVWTGSNLFGVSGLPGLPQRSGDPELQRRAKTEADTERDVDAPLLLPGRSDLPGAASGEYALGTSGEVIELDLDGSPRQRRLQGYVSRIAVGATDKGAHLTYFFAYSSVAPGQITFATRKVHGRWWSFVGNIVRGTAPSPLQRGYYQLAGTLTEHLMMEQTEQRNLVSLPSLPRSGDIDTTER
ncbi:MAG: hypothetical protein ACR2JE_01920 [Acidobacteriaceae bacterium]